MQRRQGLSGECEEKKKKKKEKRNKHLELFDRGCTVIAAKSETASSLVSTYHVSAACFWQKLAPPFFQDFAQPMLSGSFLEVSIGHFFS